MGLRTRLILFITLVLHPLPLFAGGSRNADGHIEIPITVEIRQFDTKKIEVNYRGKILTLPMKYSGLPKDLEPRPNQNITIRFSLTDWSKFSDKIQNFRLGNSPRLDLTEDLE